MQCNVIGKYKMDTLIGNGCFGYVFQATETKTRKKVAWKRMIKASKMMSREFEILDKIKGKRNVICLLDFFYSINYRNELIQNFIFPFCETNLEDVLKRYTNENLVLSYTDIKRIVFQILIGLEEIHKLNICHRDLKPENILVKNGFIFISDFGSAKVLAPNNTPYVVSRYYRAPELILGIPQYNLSIDVFSVGVIFYEFLTKRLPFKGKTEGQQLIEIFKALGPPDQRQKSRLKSFIPKYDRNLDVLWTIKSDSNFLKKLAKLSISKAELEEVVNFLNRCFSYDFEKRITAAQAVSLAFFDEVRSESQIKCLLD
jgi:serine/threonine protein kinase